MERSPNLLSLAWIPALLLVAGVWSMALGTWLQRQVSPARLASLHLRIHVGAAVLALLLTASTLGSLGPGRPVLVEAVGAWIEIHRGLALRADLVVDPLAGALLVSALIAGLLIELRAAERPGGLPRVSLGLGALAILALSESLVAVGFGSFLLAVVALEDDDGGEGRAARAAGELGLWVALAAIFAAAGALGIAHTARVAALGELSGLRLMEVGGASLASVAAVGLGVTILGRAFGARATANRALRAFLWGPGWTVAVAAIVVRLASVIALSPSAAAILGALGAAAMAVGGTQALRAESSDAGLVGLVRLTAGLVVIAAAASAWSAVGGLALVACGSLAARALAVGPRRGWALAAGEAALLVAFGHAAAVLAASAVPAAAALPIVAAGIGGAVLGRPRVGSTATGIGGTRLGPELRGLVEAHRPTSGSADDSEALAWAIPTVGLGLGALAAASRLLPLGGPSSALDGWIAPAIAPLSPVPVGLAAIGALTLAAAIAFGVGVWVGRRRAPLPETATRASVTSPGPVRRLGRALIAAPLGLQALVDRARAVAFRSLWFADGFGPPATALGLLAGLLLTLGVVYCNPQVLRVGPSRVHPVDLGGLDPFIVAPKRSGRTTKKMDATDFATAAAVSTAPGEGATPGSDPAAEGRAGGSPGRGVGSEDRR